MQFKFHFSNLTTPSPEGVLWFSQSGIESLQWKHSDDEDEEDNLNSGLETPSAIQIINCYNHFKLE